MERSKINVRGVSMKDTIKRFVDAFFITLGIFVFFAIFDNKILIGIAKAVDVVLHPLLVLPLIWVIFILAVVTAVYTTLIQWLLVDVEEMKRIQKEVMQFQKEYMEAMKSDNKYKLKKLEERKKEIQELQAKMMGPQLKAMPYSMSITMPIFYWLLYVIYRSGLSHGLRAAYTSVSNYMVNAPFFGHIHVSHPIVTIVFPIPWWIFWYFICSMPLSMLVRKVLNM